ncbi:MAG: hypothetical protein LBU88_07495 [Treponema sp.]|jgi:hypothetical protein|nr:hypothetical protein [Treponema sp.]
MKLIDLNAIYKQYISKAISRCKTEGSIYNYYLFNQRKTCLSHWQADDYEDFVSWFYPRLRESIDKYIDIGSSFEAFLNKIFFIASKEYKVSTVKSSVTEYSTWCARVPDLYVYEESPEYNFSSKEKIISKIIRDKNGRKNSRRILALLLKCYNYISDDFIDKVAPMIEIEKDDLKSMMENMRKIRQKKDDDIYLLKERTFRQYYRCMVYERRLAIMSKNTVVYDKMNHQLNTARKKLNKLRERLNLVRKNATNSQIAEVIGVCKGTVDSCLYKLKKSFNLN